MGSPPKNVEFHSVSDNPEKWVSLTKAWEHQKHKSRKTKPFKDFVLHWVPDGEYADIKAVTADEQVVGNLFYGPHEGVPNSMEGAVEVHPAFRRNGIASAMYTWAEQLSGGKKFAPAKGHTPLAEALWQSPKRPFGKEALALRVAARFAAKTIELSHYGLEGMTKGEAVTLYHGTTRTFTSFEMGKSRLELVERFYGAGIFFVPSKHIAEQYAGANRNMGLEPDIIGHLKSKNPKAGAFMESLYKHGKEAWDMLIEEVKASDPQAQDDLMGALEKHLGVDPNLLDDVCGYIEGSKIKPLGTDSGNIFDMTTGAPSWLYDEVDKLGLNGDVYRPKVYTCSIRVKNPLITASKSQAKAARSKGYDSVIFYGSDLVGGVPEVAVFNASDVRITHVEVV